MGKSIHGYGGQNPIEAARLGNRIIHGPNIENFVEVYKFLEKQGISTKIKSYKQPLLLDLELHLNYKRSVSRQGQVLGTLFDIFIMI